jgi:hypothetical protein
VTKCLALGGVEGVAALLEQVEHRLFVGDDQPTACDVCAATVGAGEVVALKHLAPDLAPARIVVDGAAGVAVAACVVESVLLVAVEVAASAVRQLSAALGRADSEGAQRAPPS